MRSSVAEKRLQKVFALQFREHQDYSQAEKHGEVQFLTRLEWNPGQPQSRARIEREIVHALREYRPGVDFILPTGSQPAQILLGRLLERQFPGKAHLILYWAPRRNEYTITAG